MVIGLGVTEASASLVVCPDPQTSSRQYGVNTTPDSVCIAYGSGNLNGAGNDAFLDATTGWEFVGQNGAFLSPPTDFSGTSGDFSFTAAAGFTYAIGIKDGGDPKWAVFQLPTGVTSGTWHVTSSGGGLSHLALYRTPGTVDPGEEPVVVHEPATLSLLGFGLLAGAARLRRRLA